jgi:hypothetical protein
MRRWTRVRRMVALAALLGAPAVPRPVEPCANNLYPELTGRWMGSYQSARGRPSGEVEGEITTQGQCGRFMGMLMLHGSEFVIEGTITPSAIQMDGMVIPLPRVELTFVGFDLTRPGALLVVHGMYDTETMTFEGSYKFLPGPEVAGFDMGEIGIIIIC